MKFLKGQLFCILIKFINSGHMISSEIFHESAEQFNEEIKKNEGIFRYYIRHLYVIGGIVALFQFLIKLYQLNYEFILFFEDAQDLMFFEYVKAMQKQPQIDQINNTEDFWINFRTK